ncbi:MAG: hypothetical protein IH991_03905, partial [Planctomycetes bacterium]|nr:hypothetical protein [Planctomycetota bacterium]
MRATDEHGTTLGHQQRETARAKTLLEWKTRALVASVDLFQEDSHHGAVRLITDKHLVFEWAELSARCVAGDVDAAWEAIKEAERPRIHVFISSSDIQIMHQLRSDPESVMGAAVASIERAKGYCDDVEFSPMDATRTDLDYLYRMLEAVINAGATTVNIPDTVGYSMPWEFRERIEKIKQNVPNIDKAVLSVHCHNDLGQAVGSSLAAITAGARQVEGCINGLGERAGNAALEEVIMALETRKDLYGVETNID